MGYIIGGIVVLLILVIMYLFTSIKVLSKKYEIIENKNKELSNNINTFIKLSEMINKRAKLNEQNIMKMNNSMFSAMNSIDEVKDMMNDVMIQMSMDVSEDDLKNINDDDYINFPDNFNYEFNVDDILNKINEKGIDSLNEEELKFLRRINR